MKLFSALIVIFGVIYTNANSVDDINAYVDEVLSVYVPWAVEEAGLTVYKMPMFSQKYQTKSRDDRNVQVQVYYHSGNITGVDTVHRKTCKEPKWISGNMTAYCRMVFPKISLLHEARLQEISSIPNGFKFRQFDFNVTGYIADMEAEIKLTGSPKLRVPTIKDLTIVDGGRPFFRFGGHFEDVSYETLSTHFFQKYNIQFQDIFYDLYRIAFERAFESIPFPFGKTVVG